MHCYETVCVVILLIEMEERKKTRTEPYRQVESSRAATKPHAPPHPSCPSGRGLVAGGACNDRRPFAAAGSTFFLSRWLAPSSVKLGSLCLFFFFFSCSFLSNYIFHPLPLSPILSSVSLFFFNHCAHLHPSPTPPLSLSLSSVRRLIDCEHPPPSEPLLLQLAAVAPPIFGCAAGPSGTSRVAIPANFARGGFLSRGPRDGVIELGIGFPRRSPVGSAAR